MGWGGAGRKDRRDGEAGNPQRSRSGSCICIPPSTCTFHPRRPFPKGTPGPTFFPPAPTATSKPLRPSETPPETAGCSALTRLMDTGVVGQLDDQELPALEAAPHRVDPADGGALQPHGHQRLAQLGVTVVLEGDAVLLLQPPAPPHARRGRRGRPGLLGSGTQQPPAGGQCHAQRQQRPASSRGHRPAPPPPAPSCARRLFCLGSGTPRAGAARGAKFRSSLRTPHLPGPTERRPRAGATQRRGAKRRLGGPHYWPPSPGELQEKPLRGGGRRAPAGFGGARGRAAGVAGSQPRQEPNGAADDAGEVTATECVGNVVVIERPRTLRVEKYSWIASGAF